MDFSCIIYISYYRCHVHSCPLFQVFATNGCGRQGHVVHCFSSQKTKNDVGTIINNLKCMFPSIKKVEIITMDRFAPVIRTVQCPE